LEQPDRGAPAVDFVGFTRLVFRAFCSSVDSLVSVEEDAPLLLRGLQHFPLAIEDLAEGAATSI
jgi:hypothetical protein